MNLYAGLAFFLSHSRYGWSVPQNTHRFCVSSILPNFCQMPENATFSFFADKYSFNLHFGNHSVRHVDNHTDSVYRYISQGAVIRLRAVYNVLRLASFSLAPSNLIRRVFVTLSFMSASSTNIPYPCCFLPPRIV